MVGSPPESRSPGEAIRMSPKHPEYDPHPEVADLQPLVEDEKPAAYAGCPVEHPTPMLLNGPGCPTVLIEDKNAWRALRYGYDPPFSEAGTGEPYDPRPERVRRRPETDALRAKRRETRKAVETADAAAKAAPTAENTAAAEAAKKAALETMSAEILAVAGLADIHTCETPYPSPLHGPGLVVDTESTVFATGYPMAREGDTILEAIGPLNKVFAGCATVLLGGAYYPEEVGEEEVNGIVVRGTRAFRSRVKEQLEELKSKPKGRRVVEELERQAQSGKGTTIEYGPNRAVADDPEAAEAAGSDYKGRDEGWVVTEPGEGSGTTVYWDPDEEVDCKTGMYGKGTRGGSSSGTALGHELVHACHNGKGTALNGRSYDDPGIPVEAKRKGKRSYAEEAKTIGQPPYDESDDGCVTENDLREERGEDPRETWYMNKQCREEP